MCMDYEHLSSCQLMTLSIKHYLKFINILLNNKCGVKCSERLYFRFSANGSYLYIQG